MLKNCVLKPSVNTVKWAKAAGIRAVKKDVSDLTLTECAALAAIVSVITSIAGIPELEDECAQY